MHQAILFANLIGAPRSSTLSDHRPHASSAVPVAQGILVLSTLEIYFNLIYFSLLLLFYYQY